MSSEWINKIRQIIKDEIEKGTDVEEIRTEVENAVCEFAEE